MIRFNQKSKRLNYKVVTKEPVTGAGFNFGFGEYNGTGDYSKYTNFYGISGKLYDQENNYFGSYRPDQDIIIRGTIFSGHHNYFYNGELMHDRCTRTSLGSGINAFFENNLYTGYGITVYGSESF